MRHALDRIRTAWNGRTGPRRYRFALRDWAPLFDVAASAQVLETKRFTRNLRPEIVGAPSGRDVVVVAPHPDDDVLGPGGTLIQAIAAGCRVRTVYVTDGARDADRASRIRAETEEVCRSLGSRPRFLGHRPRAIRMDTAAVRAFDEAVAGADVVFVPFLLDDHDDHRRVNELLLMCRLDDDVAVWAYQVYSTVLPNVVVDITDQIDEKVRLLSLWRHVSGERDWGHYMRGLNAVHSRYIPSRRPTYGETFFQVPLGEYRSLCRRYFAHPAGVYHEPAYRHGNETRHELAAVRP